MGCVTLKPVSLFHNPEGQEVLLLFQYYHSLSVEISANLALQKWQTNSGIWTNRNETMTALP